MLLNFRTIIFRDHTFVNNNAIYFTTKLLKCVYAKCKYCNKNNNTQRKNSILTPNHIIN